jgi:hypothetical protein
LSQNDNSSYAQKLERMATRLGLQTRYQNRQGQNFTASPESLQQAFQILGYEKKLFANEKKLDHFEENYLIDTWKEALEPCQVFWPHSQKSFFFSFPAPKLSKEVHFSLFPETKSPQEKPLHTLKIRLSDLPLISYASFKNEKCNFFLVEIFFPWTLPFGYYRLKSSLGKKTSTSFGGLFVSWG